MKDIHFFDCNCSFGETPRPPFRFASDPHSLLEEMDLCGIDRALVHHAGARFGCAPYWNERLPGLLAGLERLVPAWTLLPPQTGETPDGDALISAMRDSGIRALLVFPQEHRYRLQRRTFGDLLGTLARRRIPLFVKESLPALGDFLEECPDLVVVAMNQGPHSVERYLRPLLDAFPNLYLDSSYYIIDGAIEEFCARYGPDRLLFGSAYPDNCAGGALLQLLHADIDEADRRAIAGTNLVRLLSEARL